ncbi:hypothetical protein SAMN05421505_10875 [Sinosporangium album]|uniref:Uncharacterized protein n=1 Tax=Sinosporangium album TaxID=504805 RepID=A0A1G7X7S9_9ACTN|nr:hypothetical protein [Sinosporangium album]SDG80258.1 hypothetical protein SAMN05421505_10875 [Sinosporangium album]
MLSRTSIIVLAAVAALVAIGGVTLWWLWGGDGPRPAHYRAESSTGLYKPIETRAADAEPLSLIEVFGQGTDRLSVAGEAGLARTALVRGETAVVDDCADVVWGSAVGDALESCSQVVKALYAGEDGRSAGQFLIFNMASSAGADTLVKALRDQGFVLREAAFDASRSWAQARALGHYVTVSWIGPVGEGTGRVDLTGELVALDGLGAVVRERVVSAG